MIEVSLFCTVYHALYIQNARCGIEKVDIGIGELSDLKNGNLQIGMAVLSHHSAVMFLRMLTLSFS